MIRFRGISVLAQAIWWHLLSIGLPPQRFRDGIYEAVVDGDHARTRSIAAMVRRSERQVNRAIAELKDAGMVEREQGADGVLVRVFIQEAIWNQLMEPTAECRL